ncbi:vegetative cell wall protein gp1-like [Quercus lobata]|uniref:vegetative cell wall protein gp1-like n=1 Tax=Quercus lobata TaxID=97700 RepID=UPI001244D4A7|nr:vegetative cell wall protein gp1-like [Quercus lobata]
MLPPGPDLPFSTQIFYVPKHVLSLSAISSTLIKRTWTPFYSFNSTTTAKAPPLLLISQYSSIIISLRNQNPTSLSALLLPNNDPFKSPPELPKLPNHQPLPTVPLEVPQISTTPEIDPANPPPYGPDPVPVPGPEFPKPAIPPQPDPGPELPKPPIPPRPNTQLDPGPELPIPSRPDPDIPLPKPDVVPLDYIPQRPQAGTEQNLNLRAKA